MLFLGVKSHVCLFACLQWAAEVLVVTGKHTHLNIFWSISRPQRLFCDIVCVPPSLFFFCMWAYTRDLKRDLLFEQKISRNDFHVQLSARKSGRLTLLPNICFHVEISQIPISGQIVNLLLSSLPKKLFHYKQEIICHLWPHSMYCICSSSIRASEVTTLDKGIYLVQIFTHVFPKLQPVRQWMKWIIFNLVWIQIIEDSGPRTDKGTKYLYGKLLTYPPFRKAYNMPTISS